MKILNKRYLALVVAGAMGLSACGSDGKDGEDGTTPPPPTVEGSQVTNVEMLSHTLEEGLVRFEFEITNEEGVLITGLEQASAEVAALTEKGIQRSRDGSVGGSANASTDGASLTMTQDGRYEFVAPMAAVNAGTEGLIRLAVGGGDNIAKSRYIVVDKTENIHTTSTATCQSCHVDFLASSIKHSSYTAINPEGETDLVAGCMACHNHVPRDVDDGGNSLNTGGYAKNSLQKIGHINHQQFEGGFAPSNCYTCHAEPITQVYTTDTCLDCHIEAGVTVPVNMNAFAADQDFRSLHTQMPKQQTIDEVHYTVTSTPELKEGLSCTTLSLLNTASEQEVALNIGEMVGAGEIAISMSFMKFHGNITDTASGTTSSTDNQDGSREYCTTYVTPEGDDTGLMALSRVTFSPNEGDQVIISSKSAALFADGSEEARRFNVTSESCTTCHNSHGEFHKTGGFADGGMSCLSCHYTGKDRRSGYSGPGFGPMIHGKHWGEGSYKVVDGEKEYNSAAALDAVNCVACHDSVVDLYEMPNQYMPSKSFNGGSDGVVTSQITANCFACHNDEQAKNHMMSNGGEINTLTTDLGDEWYLTPTNESCATCHAEGKSYGIEKFHKFER